MLKLILIGTVSLGIGAGIGWTARGANSPTEAAAQTVPQAVAQGWAPSQPLAGPALDIAQLRAVLREELAAERSTAGSSAPTRTGPAVDELAPSPAVVAARRDAIQAIDTMVANGQWGNEERASFQQKMLQLDPQQAEQELQKVTMALNAGTIQVHTDGSPL